MQPNRTVAKNVKEFRTSTVGERPGIPLCLSQPFSPALDFLSVGEGDAGEGGPAAARPCAKYLHSGLIDRLIIFRPSFSVRSN